MSLKDHLNKIEYYCAVVEARSILQASRMVGITQPQLSRVVKQLEADLEAQLFVRTSSGVEPTKEGQTLYLGAKEILESIGEMERSIKYGQIKLKGDIRIGTYDSIARYFFPSFLKYLKAAIPKLNIHLETTRSPVVIEKVKKGTLDIGICVASDNFKPSPLVLDDIYSDAFGFYHHPGITKEFKEQLIIFPQSAQIKAEGVTAFAKGFRFPRNVLTDNLETVKSLSEEAVGVGFLPHRVAREAVLQGKLVRLSRISSKKELFPHRVVLCRQRSSVSPEIQSVITELSRFLSSWSRS